MGVSLLAKALLWLVRALGAEGSLLQASAQAPQSVQRFGSMNDIRSTSSAKMQNAGQTSIQAWSFTPIQASVTT